MFFNTKLCTLIKYFYTNYLIAQRYAFFQKLWQYIIEYLFFAKFSLRYASSLAMPNLRFHDVFLHDDCLI